MRKRIVFLLDCGPRDFAVSILDLSGSFRKRYTNRCKSKDYFPLGGETCLLLHVLVDFYKLNKVENILLLNFIFLICLEAVYFVQLFTR